MTPFNSQSFRCISLIILLVSVVFLYLFYLEIGQPNYFCYDDNANYFLPSYSYTWRSVVDHKTIPLINFHQYLGNPFLAQGQTGIFYLPVYISLLLSKITTGNIFYTIDVLAFTHLMASVIGMFLLLRRFQLSAIVSFLGSLIWITMPFIITISRTWIFLSYTAAYLPFNFLLVDKLTSEPRIKNALYLALLKSALFYQGYIQYVFMTVVFEVIYLILLSANRTFPNLWASVGHLGSRFKVILIEYKDYLKKFLKMYLFSAFFFFFLIAPLFFPMISQQRESAFRSTKLYFKEFISNAISWRDFIPTQFFYFQQNVIFGGDSEIFYFGFINLLLLSLVLSKKRRPNYKILVCILTAGIAMLFSTRLYAIFYYVPGFNLFRWPFKYYLFFLFFATIGISGIANTLIQKDGKWVKIGMYSLLSLAIGLNCLVLWHKPENAFNLMRIDNSPTNYLEKYISKKRGRIFTFWLKDIKPQEFYKYYTFSFATLFDYFHFGGYDPFISKQNHELSLNLGYSNIYKDSISQALLDYLSLWSARYFITSDNFQNRFQLSHFPQLKLTYEGNNILLYENTHSLPLAYYNDNKLEKLEFDFSINEINVFPDNNSPRTIVINVAPLPRFQIYVNGTYAGKVNPEKVPIRINIPPNTKQVTLKYVDYPFYVGTLVFILFWACILFFGLYKSWEKHKNRAVSQD